MNFYKAHMAEASNLRNLIHSCQACSLRTSNRVPFGGVTWSPKLIFLGEAPGAEEDREGVPFIGRAGHLLTTLMEDVGLKRHHGMYVNTVCCRPPQNRDPLPEELEACSIHLRLQLRLGQTWVGVALGKVATETLIGKSSITLGAYKGRALWAHDMLWIPTYHPAYVLRNKGAGIEVKAHIKTALNYLNGELEPPRPKTSEYRMERRCVVVDHEDVEVPDKILEISDTVFTLAEWVKLKYSPKALQDAAILAKRELGAEVLS